MILQFLRNKVKAFISNFCQIKYDKLVNDIIHDPILYIRNLSSTQYVYVFDINTNVCNRKKITAIINRQMPTYINFFDKGELIYSCKDASIAQLFIQLVKDFINE